MTVVVAGIEIIRCMCGPLMCRYCGKPSFSRCQKPTHCPHCGCPTKLPLNATDAEKRREGEG